MAKEYVILVDDGDREIGRAEKLDAHRKGALHRAFSVVIWNDDGRMLLQRRADGKYHSAGLWSNACCGHPRPGEDVTAAAERRLREEMGLACALMPLGTIRYRADFDNGLSEHEIVHIYRGTSSGPVTANPDEVSSHVWLTVDEIRADVIHNPDSYSVWFRAYVDAAWPIAMTPPA